MFNKLFNKKSIQLYWIKPILKVQTWWFFYSKYTAVYSVKILDVCFFCIFKNLCYTLNGWHTHILKMVESWRVTSPTETRHIQRKVCLKYFSRIYCSFCPIHCVQKLKQFNKSYENVRRSIFCICNEMLLSYNNFTFSSRKFSRVQTFT